MQKHKIVHEIAAFSAHMRNRKRIFAIEDPHDTSQVYFSFDGETKICKHARDKKEFLRAIQHGKTNKLCLHKDCKVAHDSKFKLIGAEFGDLPLESKMQIVEEVMKDGYETISRAIASGVLHSNEISLFFRWWRNGKHDSVPDLKDNQFYIDNRGYRTDDEKKSDPNIFQNTIDRLNYDILDLLSYVIRYTEILVSAFKIGGRIELRHLLVFLADFTQFVISLDPLNISAEGTNYDLTGVVKRITLQLLHLYGKVFGLTSVRKSKLLSTTDQLVYDDYQDVLSGAGPNYATWIEKAIANLLTSLNESISGKNALVFLADDLLTLSANEYVEYVGKSFEVRAENYNDSNGATVRASYIKPERIQTLYINVFWRLYFDPCSIPRLIRLFDKYLKLGESPNTAFFARRGSDADLKLDWFKSLFFMVQNDLPILLEKRDNRAAFYCRYHEKTKQDFNDLAIQFEKTFQFFRYATSQPGQYHFWAAQEIYYNSCKTYFKDDNVLPMNRNILFARLKEDTQTTLALLANTNLKVFINWPVPTNLTVVESPEFNYGKAQDEEDDEEKESSDNESDSDDSISEDDAEASEVVQRNKKQKTKYKLFAMK
jgi:hypothetical protein